MWQKLLKRVLTLFDTRPQLASSALPFPLLSVQFLTRTQANLAPRLGWGEFVPGDFSHGERVSAVQKAGTSYRVVPPSRRRGRSMGYRSRHRFGVAARGKRPASGAG